MCALLTAGLDVVFTVTVAYTERISVEYQHVDTSEKQSLNKDFRMLSQTL